MFKDVRLRAVPESIMKLLSGGVITHTYSVCVLADFDTILINKPLI